MAKISAESEAFGQEIKRLRKELGLSQTELAEKMGGGADQTLVSVYEKGRRTFLVGSAMAEKFSVALGVPVTHWLPFTKDGERLSKLPTLHPVDPADTVALQDWGEVSAGEPRPLTEPSTVRVPKALLPKSAGTLAMFRVRGQSMTKKHIQDGSVLFVRIDPAPSPGEKVVAVVNSRKKRGPRGYVVKILKQGVDGLELHSASEEEPAEPIPVDDTVDVVGVVVGVFNT